MKIKEIALPHLLAAAIALFLMAGIAFVFRVEAQKSYYDIAVDFSAAFGSIIGVLSGVYIAIWTINRQSRLAEERTARKIINHLSRIRAKITANKNRIFSNYSTLKLIKNESDEKCIKYIQTLENEKLNELKDLIIKSILFINSDDRIFFVLDEADQLDTKFYDTIIEIYIYLQDYKIIKKEEEFDEMSKQGAKYIIDNIIEIMDIENTISAHIESISDYYKNK